MERYEEARRMFTAVRNHLDRWDTLVAYRLAWKKPFMFYASRTKEEAVAALIAEARALMEEE